MIKIKKIVDVLSWFIILILGLLLIVRWHEIDSNVIIHSGLFGDFSYGNKIFLVYILSFGVIINLLLTFNYDIPFTKQLKKSFLSIKSINIIKIFLQILIISIISIYIIAPSLKVISLYLKEKIAYLSTK